MKKLEKEELKMNLLLKLIMIQNTWKNRATQKISHRRAYRRTKTKDILYLYKPNKDSTYYTLV